MLRPRRDADFADEIEAHIALEADRLIAQGVPADEARARARRAFGNVTQARERFHERGARLALSQLRQDLRYAGRSLRRSPGFAIVAVLCLGLGISVNTATFSLINALLFRDFPGVVDQHRVATVLLGRDTERGRYSPGEVALPDWRELEGGVPAFADVAAVGTAAVSARTTGNPEVVRADFVSPGFFGLLGTRPTGGRLLTVTDAGDPRVAVLSWGYWDRVFQRRADLAGLSVTIGTQSFAVIGVAPRGFVGLYPSAILDADVSAPSLFLPLEAARLVRAGPKETDVAGLLGDTWLWVVGRLRDGATARQAEAQAAIVAQRLASRYPAERSGAFAQVRAGAAAIADPGTTASVVLFVMAVPLIILLVACANLANQLLARAVDRGGEIAVRLSLGASRGRVVRQLLVESAAIAVAASLVGLALARVILDLLPRLLALPYRVPFDGRVLLFSLGAAAATAMLFGLVPALRATRAGLSEVLKDRAAAGGRGRSRLQRALIVAQIAASLALISLAGVFLRAAEPRWAAEGDAGSRIAVVSLDLDLLGLEPTAGRAWQATLLERVNAMPGVVASAIAPISAFAEPDPRRIRDLSGAVGGEYYEDVAEVSGDWFGVATERLVAGRVLTPAELAGPPVVAVVDAAFAGDWWRDSAAVGRSLQLGEGAEALVVTVVGVIDSIRTSPFREADGRIIIPGSTRYDPRTYLYVRTAGPAAPLLDDLTAVVRSLDDRMPVRWTRTRDELAEQEVASIATLAGGLRALGGVALALAALGLFGVMSFVVARRRREIAVRVALGARRVDVTGLVLRYALGLGVAGTLLGAALATAAAIGFRGIIHGVPALDPASLAGSAAVMLAVAVAASLIPARRAARVDPITALREE